MKIIHNGSVTVRNYSTCRGDRCSGDWPCYCDHMDHCQCDEDY